MFKLSFTHGEKSNSIQKLRIAASPDSRRATCAAVFTLQVDNDQLRKEVAEAKKKEEKLKSELAEERLAVSMSELSRGVPLPV